MRLLFSHNGSLKILTKHENILVYNVDNIQYAVTRLTELITIANHENFNKENGVDDTERE